MDKRDYSRISNSFILTLLKAFYLFLPGIIFLVLYYFIIVKIDIGQDMLMQAYENGRPYIFTIFSILVWMLFSWYSSRLISDEYLRQCKPPHREIFEQIPRLLGFNVAVCLQIAILNLPFIHLGNLILWVVFIFNNIFYILLNKAFKNNRDLKYKQKLLMISGAITIAYIIVISTLFESGIDKVFTQSKVKVERANWALILIVIFFLFEIAFVGLVIFRREIVINNKDEKLDIWKKKFNLWRNLYNVFSAFVLIFYVLILLYPTLANNVGSIGITLLAFGLWVGFIYILKYATIKFGVHFWLPMLVLAVFYGLVYNPYKVRLQQTTQKIYNHRLSMDEFFYKWVNHPVRRDAIRNANSSNPYNVYLIMADGGASKSGFWVAQVLSKLEDSSATNNKFSLHVLCLAGASGGSVGNAAFYTLLKAKADTNAVTAKKINNLSESKFFFQGDFFSSSFATFLGPDLFRHIFPLIWMDDRAAVLEKAMETNSCSKIIGNYFSKSISKVIDSTGLLPALFINTTNLQSGAPGVVSSVRLDSLTDRLDILTLVDTVKLGQSQDSMHDIRLSTAVVLGARFPYISPAGGIGNNYFVDGGYFDNSGAGITLEAMQYIERKLNTSDTFYKDKLAFKVIYISNGSDKSAAHDLNPLVNDVAAPLLTVLGTYGMQTNLSNKKLSSFMKDTILKKTLHNSFQTLNLPMDTTDKTSYPMNWVISRYNIDRMERNLDFVHPHEVLDY